MTSGRIPTRASVLAAYRAAATGGGSGLDITTTAGGDNMKVNEPSGTDSPATDVLDSSSSRAIAIGQEVVLTKVSDAIVIGQAMSFDGTDIGGAGYDEIVAIGGYFDLEPTPGQTGSGENIYVIAHAPIVATNFAAVVIGDGPVATYVTKPDDSAIVGGDTVNGTPYGGVSQYANDQVAIGNGASACTNSDAIAIGDGAIAIGAQELIAIGTSATAGVWMYGHVSLSPNAKRFRRALPDSDCIAIGDGAEATGQKAIAIGRKAYAGRRGQHPASVYPGDWNNYEPMLRNVAIGDAAQAGVYNADLDVAGTNDNLALGSSAVASHGHSAAIGAGAVTTADHQIVLGTAADTIVIPGTLSAAGITGGGHAIAIADSGGTVTADVSTVEFTGTAVTSVTDDGSGHTTVTLDEGAGSALTVSEFGGGFSQADVVGLMFEGVGISVTCADDGGGTVLVTIDNSDSADQITVTVNLNCPGGFTYPYGTLDIRGADNHVALTLTSVLVPLAAGEGFSAETVIASLGGLDGTLTLAFAELDVTNITCDQRLSTYTSTESAPVAGIHDVALDTTDTGTKIGTDLSSDGTTTTSAAGGIFMATLSIEMYITP